MLCVQVVNVDLQLGLLEKNVINVTSLHMAKKQCLAMAEDDSVFVCKACTTNSNNQQVRKKNIGVLSCKKCNFKSAFKYNLKRHIDNMHDGNDEADQSEAEIQEGPTVVEPTVVDCAPPQYEQSKVDLKDILKDLNLESLLRMFESVLILICLYR